MVSHIGLLLKLKLASCQGLIGFSVDIVPLGNIEKKTSFSRENNNIKACKNSHSQNKFE